MTEVRKDGNIPEEVKNQIMPDSKKRVITEKLSQRYLDDLEKINREKQQLLNQMLSISVRIVDMQKQQQTIREKIQNNTQKQQNTLEHAFKKMKLGKKKEYRWQFRQDSFVGVLNPTKKKAPENPKK